MPPTDPLSTRPLRPRRRSVVFLCQETGLGGIAPLAPIAMRGFAPARAGRAPPGRTVKVATLSSDAWWLSWLVAALCVCVCVRVGVWVGIDVQHTTNALIDILQDPDSTTEFDCGCWPQYKDALIGKYESLPADGTPNSASAPTATRRLLQDNVEDGTCGGVDTVRTCGSPAEIAMGRRRFCGERVPCREYGSAERRSRLHEHRVHDRWPTSISTPQRGLS